MDKPLHVRVAEALGWRWVVHSEEQSSLHHGMRFLLSPDSAPEVAHLYAPAKGDEPLAVVERTTAGTRTYADWVPRYDTSWEATGPLIERYGIHVFKSLRGWHAAQDASWITLGIAEPPHGTPLLAVCHLILALHAAGKLAA